MQFHRPVILKKKDCVTSPGADNFLSGNDFSSALGLDFLNLLFVSQKCNCVPPGSQPTYLSLRLSGLIAHHRSYTDKCTLACCSCRCTCGEDVMK